MSTDTEDEIARKSARRLRQLLQLAYSVSVHVEELQKDFQAAIEEALQEFWNDCAKESGCAARPVAILTKLSQSTDTKRSDAFQDEIMLRGKVLAQQYDDTKRLDCLEKLWSKFLGKDSFPNGLRAEIDQYIKEK